MHRYVIERELTGVGSFSPDQIRDAAKASNAALSQIGRGIQWEHSYVTADRIYCVYLAENEQLVREHAKRAGVPATIVSEVKRVIDPLSEQQSA